MRPKHLIAFASTRHVRLCAVACLAVLMLLGVLPAAAHGYILRAIPEAGASLERSPARVQYWFSEPLEAQFSTVTVRSSDGTVIAEGGVNSDQPILLEARLPANLPDDVYLSEMRIAFASDGHVVTEVRAFSVGESGSSAVGGPTADTPVLLEVVWRFGLTAGLLLLTGALGIYALVLVGAWGNPQHAAGHLPPRVMRVFLWLCAAALALAGASHLVALIQQTLLFFNADFSRALSDNLFNAVRFSTRFGEIWNFRLILLLILAGGICAVVYVWQRRPEWIRPLLTAGSWVAALALATLSLNSHAAGSLMLPWAALAADWLHLCAIALWVGGLTTLTLVMPAAMQPYAPAERRLVLLAALNRFSPLAAVCMAIVVTSGLFSASSWLLQPADVTTRYGMTLVIKVLLATSLIAVGALHRIALNPQLYARLQALAMRLGLRLRGLRLEAALAAATLLAAAFLSATPVPKPPAQGGGMTAPSALIRLEDLNAALSVLPGGPGVNTVDITLSGDVSADDAAVRVQVVNPQADVRSTWIQADSLDAGLYTITTASIDRSGEWWLLADIDRDDVIQRAAFAFSVVPEAAVVQTRDPSVLNLLLLVGLLAACGVAILPLIRRAWTRLDKGRTAVAVGLAGAAGGALVIALGIIVSQNAVFRFTALTQPPPSVVNPILPDAASLERGAIYFESCAWQGTAGWVELTRRLPDQRDDMLFAVVRDGWRSLPPCPQSLTDRERWDIVNFIRTAERQVG